MASTKGSPAPSSFAEGMNSVVSAIAATMTTPDSAPHLPLLQQLLQAAVGGIQKAAQPPKGPAMGGPPPGGPMGAAGGTNIAQLMGQAPGGPSAGPGAPQMMPGASPSGVSADDLRRAIASQSASAA